METEQRFQSELLIPASPYYLFYWKMQGVLLYATAWYGDTKNVEKVENKNICLFFEFCQDQLKNWLLANFQDHSILKMMILDLTVTLLLNYSWIDKSCPWENPR